MKFGYGIFVASAIALGSVLNAGPVRADHGAYIAKKSCAKCHGDDGMTARNGTPYLAGQHANYLAAALRAYAKGARPHMEMREIAKTLAEPDIINVADYYARQTGKWKGAAPAPVPVSTAPDPQRVAAGSELAKPCRSCHGAEGISERPGIPSLAGLSADYLYAATRSYVTEARRDAIMNTFKDALDEQETRTIAAYFASLPRRKTDSTVTGNVKAGQQAAAACTGCHGRHGDSRLAQYPSLSGQNADYLYKALVAYRDGARSDAQMRKAVAKLPDATLRNIAAYFAQQEPAAISAPRAPAPGTFDPVADGARLAQGCVSCHGDATSYPQPGTPRLTGLHADYLSGAIAAYRSGARDHALMKSFVKDLSDVDIASIALYYALQKPAVANPATGGAGDDKAAAACNGCHGDKGNSGTPATPSLAGQDPAYLEAALEAYRSGARKHDDMARATKELTPELTRQLAHWYNAQTPQAAKVRKPDAPAVIAAKCDRCHGENGYSTEKDKPRLAGQSERYLIRALSEYKNQARQNSAMHAMSDVLSTLEIQAIAAYYARK